MTGLANTALGQGRIAAAAERLDRTAAELEQQFRADVPQGENDEMGQPLPAGPPPHFEPPVEFIPLEPTPPKGRDISNVNVGTGPMDDDRVRANGASQWPAGSLARPFQAVFVPQGDEDRAQRIAADLGMDVDIGMGSSGGSGYPLQNRWSLGGSAE